MLDSSWSEEEQGPISKPSDGIHYYIQPVNEYENTVLVLYENYMESQGYQDPVCVKDKCKGKEKTTDSNDGEDDDDDDDDDDDAGDDGDNDDIDDNDGYEIPEMTDTTLTYDILSNSPVELVLFVDSLDP